MPGPEEECIPNTRFKRIEEFRANMISKWLKWDKEIEAQVVWLFENRRWYRRVLGILESNPALNKPNPFFDWMFGNYAYSVSMGIRRLLDKDPKAISLRRLVASIAEHPYVISREYYVSQWIQGQPHPEFARPFANKDYDSYAGAGRDCLDPLRLRRAIRLTEKRCQSILTYAVQVVAHAQERQPVLGLSFKDIARPIDCIGKVHRHIHALLTRGWIGEYELVEWERWDWVFRQPWMPSGLEEAVPEERKSDE